jgi:hypothetical protein
MRLKLSPTLVYGDHKMWEGDWEGIFHSPLKRGRNIRE